MRGSKSVNPTLPRLRLLISVFTYSPSCTLSSPQNNTIDKKVDTNKDKEQSITAPYSAVNF